MIRSSKSPSCLSQRKEKHFYGRRKGKTLGFLQQQLLCNILPLFQPQDWHALLSSLPFKKVVLEIGFGRGEHIAYQAQQHPDTLFIGCEPFINGTGNLLRQIEAKKISNIYLWTQDVHELFKHLPFKIFDEVFILFPDPWPKKRHTKRRLLQHDFLNLLSLYLKDNAILMVASDEESYIDHIKVVFKNQHSFKDLPDFPSQQRFSNEAPFTNYEKKAIQKGILPWYFKYHFEQ